MSKYRPITKNNMFNKIKFLFTRPKVVVVTGRGKETASKAIIQVLQKSFRVDREILVYPIDAQNIKEGEFLLKNSKLAVLVATHAGEYYSDKEFFNAKKEDVSAVEKLAQTLDRHASLILNFDDGTIRDIKEKTRGRVLTFGFGARSDIQATDTVLTQTPDLGTNFKINFQGNIVPVWLERLFGKEHIYAALAAAAVGEVLGLNLVEISASLKTYEGVSGRMKLIEGVKNTLVLDDSESASPLSTAEGLDILKRIENKGRKIAVLGDIIGVDKDVLEVHGALGAKVSSSADLLFTVGPRARFYALGAKQKGFSEDKIFSFSTTAEAGLALQKEMKEGDLILIDGSQELRMGEVVNEIKKI